MVNYNLHFEAGFIAPPPLPGSQPDAGPPATVADLRAGAESMSVMLKTLNPISENVLITEIPFVSHDGATVSMYRCLPKTLQDAPSPTPAVVFAHGGGMIALDASTWAFHTARWAEHTGIPFFSVDFRNAPEQKGPGMADDVFHAAKHLSEHAAEWNVDPARICVMGESGGGGIAAAAALLARDRKLSPPLAMQFLIYPMLDDRTDLPADHPLHPFLVVWPLSSNKIAWEAIRGEGEVSAYTAPARAEDLSGLPPTYIDVGGLDLFRDECVTYAGRVAAANVPVEFHLWFGLPHGFEMMGTNSVVEHINETRRRFLRKL